MNNKPFITVSRLRSERGWTDSLVTRFLGEPDKLAVNPHYRSGAKMRLYSLPRVMQVESAEPCREALYAARQMRPTRSAATHQRHARDRQALLAAIDEWNPNIPLDDLRDIREKAIRSYNDWNAEREKYASEYDKAEFLDRITVNYIRHELTNYDGLIRALHGKVGKQEAIRLAKNRVLEQIKKMYPDLGTACTSQRR